MSFCRSRIGLGQSGSSPSNASFSVILLSIIGSSSEPLGAWENPCGSTTRAIAGRMQRKQSLANRIVAALLRHRPRRPEPEVLQRKVGPVVVAEGRPYRLGVIEKRAAAEHSGLRLRDGERG